MGGKISNASLSSADDTQNVRDAEKRADQGMKKLEEGVKNDW